MYRLSSFFLITLAAFGLTSSTFAGDYPAPLMVQAGDLIYSNEFKSSSDSATKSMSFRKEAHSEVDAGSLKVIPPVVAYAGTETNSKWSSSNMARAGFDDVPLELVAHIRWKYLEPEDPGELRKGRVYLDLGHRCIRLTITPEGTTLLLENHLVGKEAEISSIVLEQKDSVKLKQDHWYHTTIEVKGDEVVIQLDDEVFHGKHSLIGKERYPTLNLDVGGVGYLIDEIRIHEAGDLLASWPRE